MHADICLSIFSSSSSTPFDIISVRDIFYVFCPSLYFEDSSSAAFSLPPTIVSFSWSSFTAPNSIWAACYYGDGGNRANSQTPKMPCNPQRLILASGLVPMGPFASTSTILGNPSTRPSEITWQSMPKRLIDISKAGLDL